MHDILVDSSIIVDETFGANTVDIFKTNFGIDGNNEGRFEFLKKQQLWRIDKLQNSVGGLDWFESALPEADVVLEGQIRLNNFFDQKNLRLYRFNIHYSSGLSTCLRTHVVP